MGSTTPLLDILSTHLPAAISSAQLSSLSSQSQSCLETLLAFALGGECPLFLPDARPEWSRSQPAVLKALHDFIVTKPGTKRPRENQDVDDAHSKRQKTDASSTTVDHDLSDPPRFTLPAVSATSPVRKKVDITVHARSIRFVNPNTAALESSIPLSSIVRAFLLPTRGKTKDHWTVVLLPADAPDKAKTSPASGPQQIIFGLDARASTPLDTTVYSNAAATTTTVAKGQETAPSIRQLLSHVPVPLLEPSATFFRSACATPASGNGAAGVNAYLSAKAGTLWFLDTGILWGESKPCAFWAVEDLCVKDGVRFLSATGRTCSVILSRKLLSTQGPGSDAKELKGADVADESDEEVVETEFSMVEGREQDPITAWARNRKHLFGKRPVAGSSSSHVTAAGSRTASKNGRPSHVPNAGGTVRGPEWDDSDPEDEDFAETSSDDLEDSSSDSDSGGGEEGGAEGDGDEDVSQNGDAEESGEDSDEEELQEAHHPLLRPGAMPRMSKAAMNMVVDLVQGDLVDDVSDEEDELEE